MRSIKSALLLPHFFLFFRRLRAGRHHLRNRHRQDHRQARRGRQGRTGRRAGRHERGRQRHHRLQRPLLAEQARQRSLPGSRHPPGRPYFIAAPEGEGPGDIPVYDAARDVGVVRIEADVIEVETDNGQLQRHRALLRPQHQFAAAHAVQSDHGFEIVLPPEAVVDGIARAPPHRPAHVHSSKPAGPKKTTSRSTSPSSPTKATRTHCSRSATPPLFEWQIHVQAASLFPADNVAFLLPKSIAFKGAGFTVRAGGSGHPDHVAKNVQPGQEPVGHHLRHRLDAPRRPGPTAERQYGSQDTSTPGTGPGGGIGEPINTPDPLTKYKWWILGGLALALAAAAGFLLRKPAGAAAAPVSVPVPVAYPAPPPRRTRAAAMPQAPTPAAAPPYAAPAYSAPQPSAASHNATLLTVLKEEMFAIESEKLSGTLSAADYKEQKSALEVVLKRALKKQGS